jgi:hypothetical protein
MWKLNLQITCACCLRCPLAVELNFPSTSSNGLPHRSDSLNAAQQKTARHVVFIAVEEELCDAKRVGKHEQQDDLRCVRDSY